MQKISIITALLFFITFGTITTASAQNAKADSLVTLLQTTKNESEKQDILRRIANIYEYSGDGILTTTGRAMLKLARQENDSFACRSVQQIGNIKLLPRQNEPAIENFTAP